MDEHPTVSAGEFSLELTTAFQTHHARLLAMLTHRMDQYLRSKIEPGEILQEVFLVASRRWNEYQANKQISEFAWLYRLADDQLKTEWRRWHRAGRDLECHPASDESSIAMGLDIIAKGTTPSQVMNRDEQRSIVKSALAQLTDEEKQILTMRYYDGLRNKEVAEILGMTASAAGQRWLRALQRFKSICESLGLTSISERR